MTPDSAHYFKLNQMDTARHVQFSMCEQKLQVKTSHELTLTAVQELIQMNSAEDDGNYLTATFSFFFISNHLLQILYKN